MNSWALGCSARGVGRRCRLQKSVGENEMLTDCASCPLQGQKLVYGNGPDKPRYVIVGEGPGREEDRQGKVFVGAGGQLLHRAIKLAGLDDIFFTNTTLCYPADKKHKVPAAYCCRERLIQEIKEHEPELVITLGAIATDILLGKGGGITTRRGRVSYSEELGTEVLPTIHPAAVLRDINYYRDLLFDLKKARFWFIPSYRNKYNLSEPEVNWCIVDDRQQVFDALADSPMAVFDIETTSLDPTNCEILCGVVATKENVLVLSKTLTNDATFMSSLANYDTCWIGHNFKFDRKVLKACLGVDFEFDFDTMLAHYILDERNRKRRGNHGLKHLARIYLNAHDWDVKSYADLPQETLYKYTMWDGFYTYKLAEYFIKALERYPKQRSVVDNILVPLGNILADIELFGTRIDLTEVRRVDAQLSSELEQLRINLRELAGHDFNPNSTQQLAKILFDEFKLPQIKGRSTDKEVLAKLKGHPFVKELQKYRKLKKLHSTYVVSLRKGVCGDRIHTQFLLHGTVTGRLSSQNPNLQNQPADTPLIRNFFIADEGMKLIYADLSQAEYRVAAILSGDPFLINTYKKGGDLHDEMAQTIFDSNFTPVERGVAKSCNFGLIYGMGIKRMVTNINAPGINYYQAERIVRDYFARIPRFLRWRGEIQNSILKNRYLETSLGRRRRFPYVPKRFKERGAVFRQGVNFLPQSIASDITVLSLMKIAQRDWPVQILLTVHDSILCQVPENDAQEVAIEIAEIMTTTAAEVCGDRIPFLAKAEIGDRWGELDV